MTALNSPALTLELPITFRLARLEDLPKLEWYGQYTHFRGVFRRTYNEQMHGRRLMLLAVSSEFPIAQVFAQIMRLDKRKLPSLKGQDETVAYFYSLRVMEMFRGHGLGSRLLQEAEELVKEYGCVRTTIAAAKNNPRARQLYERLGYVVIGEDAGKWSYTDHRGLLRHVNEPCWTLEKILS